MPISRAPWLVMKEKGIHFLGPPTRVHMHRINARSLINKFERQAGAGKKTIDHLIRIAKRKMSIEQKAHCIMEEAALIAEQVKWEEAKYDPSKRNTNIENDLIWIQKYNDALVRAMAFIPTEEERLKIWGQIIKEHKKDNKIAKPRK